MRGSHESRNDSRCADRRSGIAAGTWAIFARHDQMQRVLEALTPADGRDDRPCARRWSCCDLVPDTTTAADHAELMGIGDKVYQVAQERAS